MSTPKIWELYANSNVRKIAPHMHTAKFSLTSSLLALLACVYKQQVFSHNLILLDKFCLLVCRAGKVFLDDDVRTFAWMDKFSFPAVHTEEFSLLKRWHDQLLNQGFFSRENFNVNLCCAHEQIKLVKGKFVKENLVVCTGLQSSLSALSNEVFLNV